MPMPEIRRQVAVALEAVNSKKAEDVTLLQLPRESSTFTDFFLICSGHNPRQVQAIADEVDERLSKSLGVEPNNREGYEAAEWILLDYVDFVVHIFNAQRRAYYDLERLWKSAHRLTSQDLQTAQRAPEPQNASRKRTASARSGTPSRKPAAKPATKRKSVSVREAAKLSASGAARTSSTKKAAAGKSGKKSVAKKTSTGRSGAKKKSR